MHLPSEDTKGILYESTADFTVYGILNRLSRDVFGDAENWKKNKREFLGKKKALVIGNGNIGRRVKEKLAAFMDVESFDVVENEAGELESLVRDTDVVTLHIPLTEETEHFFDKEKLSWIKNGALIVNTARGAIFDEEALYEKLKETECSAFFDVFWQEPYDGKLKELGDDVFFMTPHSASNTEDFVRAGFQEILGQLPGKYVMDKLKFGILGFGKMGQIRCEALGAMPDCQAVCVSDLNPKVSIPDNLEFVSDPEKIINDPALDAIIVATSNDKLSEYTVKALDAGKHVLCEKPPGRSVEELSEMIQAEARNPGKKLKFGFNHRNHESAKQIKRMIDSGKYGEVLWLRGRYGKSVDENFFNTWRAQKDVAGGGIFLDQGIHMLDLFLMVCDDFDEVEAFRFEALLEA